MKDINQIDAKYDSISARATRCGHQLLISREQYRDYAKIEAWLSQGDDNMLRMSRSFEGLTADEIGNPRCALLSWSGSAPKAGDEVLTIHVDTTTFAPKSGEKTDPKNPPSHVMYFRRWKFLRMVGGVGVSISDDDDMIDTDEPVGIRRLLCEQI